MLVYIAGPYRADTHDGVVENIACARQVAIAAWEAGLVAVCPHTNSAHFEHDCACPNEVYLAGDLEILRRCDAVVLVPGWEASSGTKAEIAFAEARGIPVYRFPDLPEVHPTERARPKQVAAFLDVVMAMFRVHLAKNADYSPANILGPGELGLATRVWDKIARLMNLLGWRVEIASSRFEQPLAPRCETVDDSVADLAVYAVIWQLYRRGVWGK